MLVAFCFDVHVVSDAVRTGQAMRKLHLLTALAASTLVACPENTAPTVSPPSIVSFTATPTTLPPGGGAVTLSWQVTGATGLSISGDVGMVSPVTSGNLTTAIGASTTFTLTATNAAGTTTATATVTVAATTVGPTINNFTASPASLPAAGGPVTLAWDVTGATLLSVNGTPVTPVTSGTTTETLPQNTGTTALTATFTLSATNAMGTNSSSAAVTVAGVTTAPTINSFTVAPEALPDAGGSITFMWNVTGAATVSIGAQNVSPVTSGSLETMAASSNVYALSATNVIGRRFANATVTVGGDDAPEFVGMYSGSWGYQQNGAIVAPPGSNAVNSVTITEVSANVIQGVSPADIDFDISGTYSSFSCTGAEIDSVTPNLIIQTALDGGVVCQVTGDANCGSYTLTGTAAYGTAQFDNLFPNDPLVIVQSYVISAATVTSCNGMQVSLAFAVSR